MNRQGLTVVPNVLEPKQEEEIKDDTIDQNNHVDNSPSNDISPTSEHIDLLELTEGNNQYENNGEIDQNNHVDNSPSNDISPTSEHIDLLELTEGNNQYENNGEVSEGRRTPTLSEYEGDVDCNSLLVLPKVL